MKTWTTIVIDDEPLARQRLKRLLQPYGQVELIGEADNGQTGLEIISQLRPDLVFLDIEMPVFSGLEMLARLSSQPRIVFTTAYDQYAVQAFEQNSLDYLLKPVEKERLEKTIARLEVISPALGTRELEQILRQVQPRPELKTLTVKTGDRIVLLKTSEISYAQAEEKYVYLFTTDGKKYLTDYTISGLEEKLPAHFAKIHRSYIINTEQIREIRKGFNGVYNFILQYHDRTPISSSRSNADEIKARFDL